MKCYVDLEGTIEAKAGDRVARVDQPPGAPLLQPNPECRPTATADGGFQFDEHGFMADHA